MGAVHVTLSQVDDRGTLGGALQLITSKPDLKQSFTSSGANQVSTIAAPRADGLVWSVTAKTDIWVAFGTAPNADTPDHLVLGGQTRDFTVTVANEKIAIKDAV